MKDVCLCIVRDANNERQKIHSIGVNNGEGYYSEEGGGYLNVNHKKEIFKYIELSCEEFKSLISNGLKICSCDKPNQSGYWGELYECQNCHKPSMVD